MIRRHFSSAVWNDADTPFPLLFASTWLSGQRLVSFSLCGRAPSARVAAVWESGHDRQLQQQLSGLHTWEELDEEAEQRDLDGWGPALIGGTRDVRGERWYAVVWERHAWRTPRPRLVAPRLGAGKFAQATMGRGPSLYLRSFAVINSTSGKVRPTFVGTLWPHGTSRRGWGVLDIPDPEVIRPPFEDEPRVVTMSLWATPWQIAP